MNIKIDEEFRALIRPQTEIERKHLEDAILSDGCRDPLVVWDGVLIDGHNRLEVCTKHGIEYDLEEMQFESRDEAMNWIDKNQVGRRNLTRDEFAMIVGRVYAREKKVHGGRSDRDFSGAQNDPPKTAEKVGKEFGVSPATVKRAEKLFHKVEEVKLERKTEPEPAETHAEAEEENQPLESPAPKPTPPQPRVKTAEEIRAENDAIMEEAKRRVREEAAQKKKHVHVSANSGNNEWYTPEEYIEAARRVMGKIDVDPASNDIAQEKVKAGVYYTEETNGLDKEWNGNVWMNPPYASPLIGQFCERLKEQAQKGNIKSACVLVNNATETRWFADLVSVASAVVFTKGRIRFLDPEGNPGGAPLQGQAVVYIGKDPKVFIHEFASLGWGATI